MSEKEVIQLARSESKLGQRFLALFSPRRIDYALAILAFAEASFLPIVIDPFMLGAIALRREKWLRYAVISTVASVAGAVFAYTVGALFWDAFGASITAWLHLGAALENVGGYLDRGAFLFTLIGAVTPVPYKLIAIVGGVFKINFAAFLLASVIGRAGRLIIVAYLGHMGRRAAGKVAKYITWRRMFVIGFAIGIALLWYLR